MPQRRSLLDKPIDIHQPNLPEGDPSDFAAQINRFGGGLMGNQLPGDLPSAIGSLAAMLPIGKLMAAFRAEKVGGQAVNVADQLIREHSLMPEFQAGSVGQHPELEPGELQKMIDLLKNKTQGQGQAVQAIEPPKPGKLRKPKVTVDKVTDDDIEAMNSGEWGPLRSAYSKRRAPK